LSGANRPTVGLGCDLEADALGAKVGDEAPRAVDVILRAGPDVDRNVVEGAAIARPWTAEIVPEVVAKLVDLRQAPVAVTTKLQIFGPGDRIVLGKLT